MRNIDTETEEYHAPNAKPKQKPHPEKAKKAPVKKKKENSYNLISFFRDYRTHLAFGIFLALVAIIMAICGVSFIANSAADQSVTHGRTIEEIVQSGDIVQNAGGAAGAKLGQIMMVDSFGVSSFIMAFYLFVIALAVMRVRKVKFFSFTFRCLFSIAALSVIIGLLTFNSSTLFYLGGIHGHYINQWLMDYSGALGAYSVTCLLIGLLVATYFYPIKNFFKLIGRLFIHKKQTSENNLIEESTEEEPSMMDSLENEDVEEANMPEMLDDSDISEDLEDSGDTNEDEGAGSDTPPPGPQEIPAEHLRFMPQAALEAFDDKDDAEIEEKVEPEIIPESTTKEVAATGEPELTIVSKNLGEGQSSEQQGIRNGDHIGLDQPYDVRASHSHYKFPPTSLLIERPNNVVINEAEQQANKKLIVDALRSYNIEIQRIEATIGPTVTLYEIVPAQGTRIAKIKALEDDIAMTLSALGIRIIAPMPGKGTIGIEVPNRKPQTVPMRNVLESSAFKNSKMQLPMALGATISNDIFMADLAKLPHLLVAGATGQGKSVGLNCIITSLLYSKHPDELKFVLVDPKTVEFALFETISHQYLAKLPDETKAVITDPKKVIDTLNSLCVEMENRYALLSDAKVRAIGEYNDKFTQRRLNPEEGHRFMPYIVVIVDEYADLVMVAGKEVAAPIARITQKARAVGIHMILATQRPSTDVITGMIKNNFTARIAFKVTQGVDSKTILDRPGAQRLIGRGDMLALMNGVLERVQCAFVDTPEIESICEYIGQQQGFVSCYELPDPPTEDGGSGGGDADFGSVTDEFKRCAMFIASQETASITMMQRKFEIGFNKAGRFMDQMQQMGIVGPAKGAKPRDVLMTPDEVQRLFE